MEFPSQYIRKLKHQAIFVPVGILELSVKSSSFCANVKAFILAMSPEREYLSLTSFSQNWFHILICSCYFFTSIFFHVVQIVYSDIDKDIPTENIFMHIGQIAELSYFTFRTMEWTEDHDVLLLRDILASDLFSFKKGSVARGERRELIAETLNEVKAQR